MGFLTGDLVDVSILLLWSRIRISRRLMFLSRSQRFSCSYAVSGIPHVPGLGDMYVAERRGAMAVQW